MLRLNPESNENLTGTAGRAYARRAGRVKSAGGLGGALLKHCQGHGSGLPAERTLVARCAIRWRGS